jgi:Zn-dependent M28 family amino/carboxypeptidase
MKSSYSSLVASVLPLLLSLVSVSLWAQQPTVILSTTEQIKEEFASVPCEDKDRLSAVKALFERLGASSSDISIEKYKDVENLVIRKQGSTPETIIIGAHYDKVSYGCGAVDNWTGIVAMAHVYRTVKDIPLKKTVLFVAFGKEERGLIGSRAMAGAINKEQLEQYCAMINIDSFGLAAPQVLENASSKKLSSLAADLAKEMKIPFGSARVEAADSDSSPFLRRKIPAITLHGLSNEFSTIIHTSNDKSAKVNEASVYLGYRLVSVMLVRLDETSCNANK